MGKIKAAKRHDRFEVHKYLWENRDRNNYFTGKAQDLAKMLDTDVYEVARLMTELEEMGLLKRTHGRYRIVDPDILRWELTPDVSNNL